MTPEEKILEKIRKVLIASAVIKAAVGSRVYSAHPSTIDGVVYPCVSLYLNSSPSFAVSDMSDVSVQVDIWYEATKAQTDDVYALHRTIRSLLHRANLTDAALSLQVNTFYEVGVSPLLYEGDSGLYHLGIRYRGVAI
jgi:hypothetical protein